MKNQSFFFVVVYKMNEDLTKLKICIEKPLPEEEHIHRILSDRSNSDEHHKKLRAAYVTQKLWKNNSTIKVSFVSLHPNIQEAEWQPLSVLKGLRQVDGGSVKLDPLENEEIRKLPKHQAIMSIVKKRIEPLVGLKFKLVEEGKGNVRISLDASRGCNSLVGTDCLSSKDVYTMNFAWLDVATILHEFGHALGMIHEHQNPKGESTIHWNDNEVFKWAKQTQGWDKDTTETNIIDKYDKNQLNASEYDPESIMLYFFPAKLTLDNKGTRSNKILSLEDMKYMNKIYPGGDISPEEFHKKIYGEEYGEEKGGKSRGWKKIIYIILLVIIISIFVVGIIIFLLKKKKSSDLSSDWKKRYNPLIKD